MSSNFTSEDIYIQMMSHFTGNLIKSTSFITLLLD